MATSDKPRLNRKIGPNTGRQQNGTQEAIQTTSPAPAMQSPSKGTRLQPFFPFLSFNRNLTFSLRISKHFHTKIGETSSALQSVIQCSDARKLSTSLLPSICVCCLL